MAVIDSPISLVKGGQVKFLSNITKYSDGSVLDLSSYTGNFKYRWNGSRATSASATVETPTTAGQLSYTYTLDDDGVLEYWFEPLDGGPNAQPTRDIHRVFVEERS